MVKWIFLALAIRIAAIAESPTICVDAWRGDSGLKASAEDAVSTALLATGKFRLTENCDKANYIVRGSIVERSDIRSRSESESTAFGSLAGHASASANRFGGSSSARISGSSQESGESLASTETKRQVTLTAKLVASDGTVLLAASQDSAPSKSKSALVEASEKIAKEIVQKLYPATIPLGGKQTDKSGYVKIR